MNGIYDTNLFTLDIKKKVFCSEVSDLDLDFKLILSNGNFEDGIELVSSRTGLSSDWTLSRREFGAADGELLAYHLLPTPETIKQHPGLKGYSMVIFND